MAGNKKTLTVRQQVRELVYDIRNKAYLTGEARESDGTKGYEAASNMQADDDMENSYQLRRSLANAFSLLKSQLGEYLRDDRSTSDNLVAREIDDEGVLELAFELPCNYDCSSADALGKCIHAYLVEVALGEWFSITSPEEAQSYLVRSVSSLENVKRALYRRIRPERPTYA